MCNGGAAKCVCKVSGGYGHNILNPSAKGRAIKWSFVIQSPREVVGQSSSAKKVVESDKFHQFGRVIRKKGGLRQDISWQGRTNTP